MKQNVKNEVYVELRNQLIPEASRLADAVPPAYGKFQTKEEQARNFNYYMTKLAEERGITPPGQMAILNCKNLPNRFVVNQYL